MVGVADVARHSNVVEAAKIGFRMIAKGLIVAVAMDQGPAFDGGYSRLSLCPTGE